VLDVLVAGDGADVQGMEEGAMTSPFDCRGMWTHWLDRLDMWLQGWRYVGRIKGDGRTHVIVIPEWRPRKRKVAR
jgi:hypothetical protein